MLEYSQDANSFIGLESVTSDLHSLPVFPIHPILALILFHDSQTDQMISWRTQEIRTVAGYIETLLPAFPTNNLEEVSLQSQLFYGFADFPMISGQQMPGIIVVKDSQTNRVLSCQTRPVGAIAAMVELLQTNTNSLTIFNTLEDDSK